MKKVLLGTSAIALAGTFASPALSAEWEVVTGGYLTSHVGFANREEESGTEFDGVDVVNDGEVQFRASITLDNGLKFGAVMELEGASGGDQVDETYAYVSGSFGRLQIGENDNAANTMGYAAPTVGAMGINSGSDTAYIGGEYFATTYVNIEFDSEGIQYFTPRMAGFQLGVSYARDNNKNDKEDMVDTEADGQLHNIWAVGANYVNNFGDASVAASAAYTRGSKNGMHVAAVSAQDGLYVTLQDTGTWHSFTGADVRGYSYHCHDGEPHDVGTLWDPSLSQFDSGQGDTVIIKEAVCAADAYKTADLDPTAYSFGLNVGFGGFTVGGAWTKWDETSDDNTTWGVGATYATGPWGFGLEYIHRKADPSDDEVDKIAGSVAYQVAAGVEISGWAIYAKADYDDSAAEDIDAFMIGTSLGLSF